MFNFIKLKQIKINVVMEKNLLLAFFYFDKTGVKANWKRKPILEKYGKSSECEKCTLHWELKITLFFWSYIHWMKIDLTKFSWKSWVQNKKWDKWLEFLLVINNTIVSFTLGKHGVWVYRSVWNFKFQLWRLRHCDVCLFFLIFFLHNQKYHPKCYFLFFELEAVYLMCK